MLRVRSKVTTRALVVSVSCQWVKVRRGESMSYEQFAFRVRVGGAL